MDLAFAAHQQGRAAAEQYRREGVERPPALAGPHRPPVSLTQVLKQDAGVPSEAETALVAREWTAGVAEIWDA